MAHKEANKAANLLQFSLPHRQVSDHKTKPEAICGDEAAKNEACWDGVLKLDFTCARFAEMPGRSQKGCFVGIITGLLAQSRRHVWPI